MNLGIQNPVAEVRVSCGWKTGKKAYYDEYLCLFFIERLIENGVWGNGENSRFKKRYGYAADAGDA